MSKDATVAGPTPRYAPLVAGLIAGVVGGALVVGVWAVARGTSSSSGSARTVSACDVQRVAADVLPSVVTLTVSAAEGAGTGSGVVVRTPIPGAGAGQGSSSGQTYILTNDHVIAPGGSPGTVVVTYADGRSSPATVVGTDTVTDLAVIKADDPSENADPVAVGPSADLRVGQPIVALGAPLGLSSTVTQGIVSATDRYVRVPSSAGSTHHLVGAIQTDASINPGNSGGALVDCAGRLVGINSAGASPPGDSGSVGLNFAIPSTLFAPLATELIDTGRVRHPTLGLQVAGISNDMAAQNNVSPGLFVQGVEADGPAEKAGIRAGDVVTEIDGRPVRSPDDLTQAELNLQVGDSVTLTVERGGKTSKVSVTSVSAG